MKLCELKHLNLETLKVTYSIKAFYLNIMSPRVKSFSHFSSPHVFYVFDASEKST